MNVVDPLCAQPGVDDEEIRQLVEDKVDAFWKAVEGDANKRGQVRPTIHLSPSSAVPFYSQRAPALSPLALYSLSRGGGGLCGCGC